MQIPVSVKSVWYYFKWKKITTMSVSAHISLYWLSKDTYQPYWQYRCITLIPLVVSWRTDTYNQHVLDDIWKYDGMPTWLCSLLASSLVLKVISLRSTLLQFWPKSKTWQIGSMAMASLNLFLWNEHYLQGVWLWYDYSLDEPQIPKLAAFGQY